jgi:hypothetical protein
VIRTAHCDRGWGDAMRFGFWPTRAGGLNPKVASSVVMIVAGRNSLDLSISGVIRTVMKFSSCVHRCTMGRSQGGAQATLPRRRPQAYARSIASVTPSRRSSTIPRRRQSTSWLSRVTTRMDPRSLRQINPTSARSPVVAWARRRLGRQSTSSRRIVTAGRFGRFFRRSRSAANRLPDLVIAGMEPDPPQIVNPSR